MAVVEQRILMIDKDPEGRTRLLKILSPHYKVDVAAGVTDGLDKINQNSYMLILFDFETLGIQVDLFIRSIRERGQLTRLALMTTLPLEEYIVHIRKWGITNVLSKYEIYTPEHVLLAVENFIHPAKAFGLRRYLPTNLRTEEICNVEDKSYVVSKVINFFGAHGFSSARLYDIRLVLEEMVNNAIYHGFLDEKGMEKYHPRRFTELTPPEMVKVDYGCKDYLAGFAVTDNGGVLQPKHIVDTLCRQYDKAGLYDQSGRGLFLSRRFTDTLFINIRYKKMTQIIALISRNQDEKNTRVRPFYINYIE